MVGVPAKAGLNPSAQREIVWWLAQGFGVEDAARRAGLPSTAALYRYKRTKAFADDLRTALRDRLSTELAPKAVKVLEQLMTDTAVSSRVRADAARAILDRSGFSTAESIADGAEKKVADLTTYTKAELDAIIAEGERALAQTNADEAEPPPVGAAIPPDDPEGLDEARTPVDLDALL